MNDAANVLTRDGLWMTDQWTFVRDQAAVANGSETMLLPLALYLALPKSAAHGARLAPTDDPIALIPYLQTVRLIAVDFPEFTDGRGYSIASTLRNRYRFAGELRAIGDVLIDQLFYLRRVGFSSFALRADQDRARAVKALRTFSEVYQGAAAQPLPAFRRRARPDAHGATQ